MRPARICALSLLLIPRAAAAQDTPRVGLVVGFPAQVGVVIRMSDRVAIRPAVSAARNTVETTTTTTIPILFPAGAPATTTRTTTTESSSVSVDLSGIVYLARPDALRTYVSPRFAVSHGSSTLPSTSIDFSTGGTTTTTVTTTTMSSSSYEVSGSFGAEYTLGRRFAVFGEAGPRYRWANPGPFTATFTTSSSKSRSVGIQSGVGVVVYFGS